jgi:HEPN domain-containing protein
MKRQTGHWVSQAEYDLETARVLLRSRRYVYTIFMCHLSIEKLLKACITEFRDEFPPRIHDLVRLAGLAGIQFPQEMSEFVAKLSGQGIVTRYPDNLGHYTRKIAGDYLTGTQEVFAWLLQRLRSSES